MSKFYKDADFGQGESAAKAHAGYLDFMSQKIDERNAKQGITADPAPKSALAGKILSALKENGGQRNGNESLAETANVIADGIGKQATFSAKVNYISMMVGPHFKKEGEMRPNPDVIKAVVGDVLKVTDPPPAKPKSPGM